MRHDETRWDYVLTCKISTRNPSIKISKSTRLLAILRCTLNFWLHFWVHSWLLLWDLRRTFPAHHWHTRRLVCDQFSTLRADRLSRTSMTHTFSWSQTIGPPQHKCSYVHHVRHWTEGDDESRIPPDHLISFRLKIWDFCWHEGVQINFSLAFLTRVLGQDPPTSWAKMEWFAEKVEPSATCPTKPNASTFTLCDVWPKTLFTSTKIWHEGNSSDLFRWAKRRTDNNNPKHCKCYSCENALWLTSNLCPHWS